MNWKLFTGQNKENPEYDWKKNPLPEPPTWRNFSNLEKHRAKTFQVDPDNNIVELVNAALYLRRPLLIEGAPGSGKSSLAYAVARELGLEPVLKWSINTSSNLTEGLYSYDALARLRDISLAKKQAEEGEKTTNQPDQDIGNYITLGPLGTAFLPPLPEDEQKPRVLLIDEIDKSDIDLPDDLLEIFEEGRFEIPELERIAKIQPSVDVRTYDKKTRKIENGFVQCTIFPFVILTSNGARDFPAAFLRRCLRIKMKSPSKKYLEDIVQAHFDEEIRHQAEPFIEEYYQMVENGQALAIDQLLNTIFLLSTHQIDEEKKEILKNYLLQPLDSREPLESKKNQVPFLPKDEDEELYLDDIDEDE